MMDPRLQRHPLGFLQVRDMPSEEELRHYYREKYYQNEHGNYRRAYSEQERRWFNVRIRRVAHALAQCGHMVPGTMLDVGCGEGFAMAWFRNLGWDVRGADHASDGLERMNPDLLGVLTTGDVLTTLTSLQEQETSFDLIWLTNVVEHVRDPVSLLVQLRALLSPGGACVVTVPNDGSALHQWLQQEGLDPGAFWVSPPDHLAYFDRDSLRAVCESCGWSVKTLLAEFPIDWFLTNPYSNYVLDRSRGPAAHQSRLALDLLLDDQPLDAVVRFHEAMAEVGMGRQLTAVLA